MTQKYNFSQVISYTPDTSKNAPYVTKRVKPKYTKAFVPKAVKAGYNRMSPCLPTRECTSAVWIWSKFEDCWGFYL